MSERESPFDLDEFLASLTTRPGVYTMLGADSQVLYVGKAKNLRARVSSYFRSSQHSGKTRALVSKIQRIEVSVTHSEVEALLLEQTLIKRLSPPYNIIFRDDKTYPFIRISMGEVYPRVSFHRGGRSRDAKYYGPYPSGAAVRECLNLLQKVFRVRQCDDAFFRNRSRPCLQFQINRCTGPCVGLISEQQYAEDVRQTRLFLEGKSLELVDDLVARMEHASAGLEFEAAATFRDRITALRRIQSRQSVDGEGGNLDVFALSLREGIACLHVLSVRDGRVLGGKTFFPKIHGDETDDQVLAEFVPQFYLGAEGLAAIPGEVVLAKPVDGMDVLEQALTTRREGRVRVGVNTRGSRQAWLKLAQTNAEEQLTSRLSEQQVYSSRFQALADHFALDSLPRRLECFDISHLQGQGTIASCVVFDHKGPVRSEYRRFGISGINPGDDYAAMRQALERRFARAVKEKGKLPDLLFVDGGKGQVAEARAVLDAAGLFDLPVIGVAKGAARKPGLETLFFADDSIGHSLPAHSEALLLIQYLRDEAHRFALAGNRSRRAKVRVGTTLETIPGIGPKRRKQLLNYFGGLQQLRAASQEDIAQVPGISRRLASEVYDALRG